MTNFRLTVDSVVKLSRKHQWLLAETDRAMHESLVEAANKALATVASKPIFTPRTGALQDATKTRIVRTSGGKLLRIYNDKKYAAAIDKGSRAHRITAKRGRLRFSVGGKTLFRQSVNHPGTKPYRFLQNATQQAGERNERALRTRLGRIASRF